MKKYLKKLCLCIAITGIAYTAMDVSQPAYAKVDDDVAATIDFMEGVGVGGGLVDDDMIWCGKNSKGCKEQPTTNSQSIPCNKDKGSECSDTGTTTRGKVCQCCGVVKVIDNKGKTHSIDCGRMIQK